MTESLLLVDQLLSTFSLTDNVVSLHSTGRQETLSCQLEKEFGKKNPTAVFGGILRFFAVCFGVFNEKK